ncbi:MAG: tryptophan 7-halogenase [Verrucomicrobia bacterium]|nr:tryptophan 7-halogenase [Verrucomicrobiota bacterium]
MLDSSKPKPIGIIGGGPAGSIAALCLRKLNRDAEVFEKSKFPRYRIGESLLPGTLSILSRLGLADQLETVGFSKKRAATFIWGPNHEPWTFSFATPKTRSWTYDHAYQVERAEFDQLLLNAARERGATIHEDCEVTHVSTDNGKGGGRISWRKGTEVGTTDAPWIIDGSGRRGLIATSTGSRQFDPYFKNMAIWSYFKGGKRYSGNLKGNIFSVATNYGWIWIIPLRNDTYSVGVVTDESVNERIRETDLVTVFEEMLTTCDFTRDLLKNAERCDKIRATRDWAYEASVYATEKAFLCGDAACFIDPLFSQGVHLAAFSAVLASACIDHLIDNPEASSKVQQWYDQSYREAYNGYHEFLTAFYACNSGRPSNFWKRRAIFDEKDSRFEDKAWFASSKSLDAADTAAEIARRGMALGELWRHASGQLSDDFDEMELSLRRLRWAGDRMKQFQQMKSVRWTSPHVRLASTFKVDPLSFKLEETACLEDGAGRCFRNFPANENHRQLFESSRSQRFSFRELSRELRKAGADGLPTQITGELLEQGFLTGYDSNDQPISVENPLRFRGVGATDPLA